MALSIPPSVQALRSLACSRISNGSLAFVEASSKQQQRQKSKTGRHASPSIPSSSPLLTAEEIASRFGLEMAVADLERRFRKASGIRGDPPDAGSSGRPVRVAYQGVRGSYCQEAAAKAFPSLSYDSFPCTSMEDAFSALEDFSAHRSIVPAENSIDGPIDRNLDLLLRHGGVRIIGELVLPVNHCLLSLPGTSRSGLRRIVSHPQALSHCHGRLEALGLEVDEVSSAADAALFVSENCIADTAVIGSKIAAREFGLQVLEDNFQDEGGNFNRFLQLGLAPAGSFSTSSSSKGRGGGGPRKTTVAFALDRGVADLLRAMEIFESRGVKVVRVEHRPNRSKPVRVVEKEAMGKVTYLEYVFVLDLEGSESEPKVAEAVARLSEIAGFVRVLGTYTCTCETCSSSSSSCSS